MEKDIIKYINRRFDEWVKKTKSFDEEVSRQIAEVAFKAGASALKDWEIKKMVTNEWKKRREETTKETILATFAFIGIIVVAYKIAEILLALQDLVI